MTTDMLLGGLMILTMVAGIVIAMTSSRDQGDNRFDADDSSRGQGARNGRSRHD
jgi:hypothetical protein